MKKSWLIFLILAVLTAALFYNLGAIELRAEEPRRAVVSMEMIFLNDYIVLHLNGWHYYNKPPVFNWVMVGFFEVFGSYDEWVVRLPSLLSYILIGVFGFYIFKRYVKKEVAILASLFFLVSGDLLFYGAINSGEIDLFFSLLVFLQIMALFVFYQKKQWLLMFLVSYFFAALGTLTKGPPSVAFQGLTLLGMAFIYKDWRMLFRWQHVVAGFGFLALCTGYFYWYSFYADAPSMIIRLFKEATMRTGLESKSLKILLQSFEFPFTLLKLMAPGSLLLFFLFKKGLITKLKANPLILFSVMFILINIPIYWFTGDFKNRYIYMFFPFFMLLASYLYVERTQEMPKLTRVLAYIFGSAIALFGIAFFALPFVEITSNISNVSAIALAFGGGLFATLWLYFKRPTLRMYTVILAVSLLRFGFNFVYHPLVNAEPNSISYEAEMDKMLEIAGEEHIEFLGPSRKDVSDASVGPIKFAAVTLITPREMPYEMPYYYSKRKLEPLFFVEEMQAGKFYMGRAMHLEDGENEILHRFTVPLYGDMVLIKYKN